MLFVEVLCTNTKDSLSDHKGVKIHKPSISSTFFAHFFRMNVVSAAFFTYICRKKAAEMTFVRKKRAKSVDEIDTRCVVKSMRNYNNKVLNKSDKMDPGRVS